MTPAFIALFIITLHVQDPQPARTDCREWQECRQLALDAAARQEYETFHDLAWRAVQTGAKNDPALMYLLARAQSLSGRPGDALVMLQRLAQMGAKTDAATNDDFLRVRALPAWASSVGVNPEATEAPPATVAPASPPSAGATGAEAAGAAPADRLKPPAVTASPTASPSRKPLSTAAAESFRFSITAMTPVGLAYDAVSRRFIVADRDARKLAVIDEFSQHVANLASAQSAGFGSIAALEIDSRQGNLWVVSDGESSTADPASRANAPPQHATLHKLQLVSGRVLETYALSDRFGPARFVDVAATSDSTVLALDVSGHRVFRLRAKSAELEVAATLPDEPASSIAPASESLAYVATDAGIAVVDLVSRTLAPLKAAADVDLARIARLRWHKGALIAIQQRDGSYRVVRFVLDRTGRRATGEQILDASLPTTEPTSATISGGALYYLASGDGGEMIIRKITLP